MDLLIAIIGWVGAGLLVTAYGAVSAGRLPGGGLAFQLLNIVGGVALTVNTGYHAAWPSAALNVVWVAVGAVTLLRRRATPLRAGQEVLAAQEGGCAAGGVAS